MERLTEKRGGQNVIPLRQDEKTKWVISSVGMGNAPTLFLYGDHANKLADYEDAEEQGLLLRLPCKVGDTVYFHWKCSDETTIVHRATVKEICMGTYMAKTSVKYKVEPLGYVGKNRIFYISDFGFCIFLTKEEAEAKLKEMESE